MSPTPGPPLHGRTVDIPEDVALWDVCSIVESVVLDEAERVPWRRLGGLERKIEVSSKAGSVHASSVDQAMEEARRAGVVPTEARMFIYEQLRAGGPIRAVRLEFGWQKQVHLSGPVLTEVIGLAQILSNSLKSGKPPPRRPSGPIEAASEGGGAEIAIGPPRQAGSSDTGDWVAITVSSISFFIVLGLVGTQHGFVALGASLATAVAVGSFILLLRPWARALGARISEALNQHFFDVGKRSLLDRLERPRGQRRRPASGGTAAAARRPRVAPARSRTSVALGYFFNNLLVPIVVGVVVSVVSVLITVHFISPHG